MVTRRAYRRLRFKTAESPLGDRPHGSGKVLDATVGSDGCEASDRRVPAWVALHHGAVAAEALAKSQPKRTRRSQTTILRSRYNKPTLGQPSRPSRASRHINM